MTTPPERRIRAFRLRTLFVALVLAAVPVGAAAQEAQVALDQEGLLMEVDRPLAQRLGLFLDDYPDLQVARLYQLADGSYVLEVSVRRDGRALRERVAMTADEVAALRARVTAALAERAPEATLDQDGRFLLLGTTTFLGLGFYGWAVPVMLDVESGRVATASYMLTAGASFILPYLYTRDRPVSYGMANAGFWGATRGISHGLYLSLLLDEDPGESLALGLGMGASLGEGLAMYNWARSTNMSAGHAHAIGNHGDFGHHWAGMGLLVLQPDAEQAVAGALLAGSGLGLAWGASRAPGLPYTWGDAEVQRLAYYLGAANAVALWDWFLGDDGSEGDIRVLGAALLAGSILGLRGGESALEGLDFSAGQGILLDLGTIAGGLVGAGIAILVASDDFDDATPLFTLAAIGADIGFLATFASLRDDASQRAERGTRSLDIQLNPGALLLLGDDGPLGRMAPGAALPLLSFRYRF